jgi:hypothetical protein
VAPYLARTDLAYSLLALTQKARVKN